MLYNVFLHVLPWASLDQTSFTTVTYVTKLANDELSSFGRISASAFWKQIYQKKPRCSAASRTSPAQGFRSVSAGMLQQSRRANSISMQTIHTLSAFCPQFNRVWGGRGCCLFGFKEQQQKATYELLKTLWGIKHKLVNVLWVNHFAGARTPNL